MEQLKKELEAVISKVMVKGQTWEQSGMEKLKEAVMDYFEEKITGKKKIKKEIPIIRYKKVI